MPLIYQCPDCEFIGPEFEDNHPSTSGQWIEVEVYCEDCGSHYASQCPQCHAVFDHVWDKRKEIKHANTR